MSTVIDTLPCLVSIPMSTRVYYYDFLAQCVRINIILWDILCIKEHRLFKSNVRQTTTRA